MKNAFPPKITDTNEPKWMKDHRFREEVRREMERAYEIAWDWNDWPPSDTPSKYTEFVTDLSAYKPREPSGP